MATAAYHPPQHHRQWRAVYSHTSSAARGGKKLLVPDFLLLPLDAANDHALVRFAPPPPPAPLLRRQDAVATSTGALIPRAIHNIYGLTAWILRPFTWTAHQLLAFTVHFALSAYTGLTQSLLEWMAAQSS